MISVVMYGRNDSYGYNLHKRASISLNCIAELLTEKDDEILFVDYNTPDDFPTFIEAIQDLLTPKAHEKIKIIRVRPEFHKKHYEGKTHLIALEPIARNIAIRRSNPNNRWILSTNTDMVFTPLDESCHSLSALFHDLNDGLYELPRFEMPESLWEGVDRKDPKAIISSFKKWGRDFNINDVVYAAPYILYDGPGDFQLILRKDLFEFSGFDEEMILGWHVDSNICKRLHLKYKETKSALHLLYGYHCDHTRQATKMHVSGSPENDYTRFITNITTPFLDRQKKTWGAPQESFEVFALNEGHLSSQKYIKALKDLCRPQNTPLETFYMEETFNENHSYDSSHVFPYILDNLVSFKSDVTIGYAGFNETLVNLLSQTLTKLGFTHKLKVYNVNQSLMKFTSNDHYELVENLLALREEGVVILDCGLDHITFQNLKAQNNHITLSSELINHMKHVIESVVHWEAKKNTPERSQILGVNVIHNEFELLFGRWINHTRTPYSSRVRRGILRSDILLEKSDLSMLSEPKKIKSPNLLTKIFQGLLFRFFIYGFDFLTDQKKIAVIQKLNKSYRTIK
jgi:hypothetical protein